VAWYPSLYAPRAGGAYDSHHRTAGFLSHARRRGCGVLAARAQQGERMRRIGVLLNLAADDPDPRSAL